MTEIDVRLLYATTNALVWTEAFLGVLKDIQPEVELDKGWVLGWFANAIETGRDHGARAAREEP